MLQKTEQNITGSCYCGSVQFSIASDTRPFLAGFCHCRGCRQAHAAPIYQYVYVEQAHFQIDAGSTLLNWYTKEPTARKYFKRYFCSRCGSKVYNYLQFNKDNKQTDLCGTFPSLFDDQEVATTKTWSPQKHIYCAESIMNLDLIKDELPRY
ncbi:MAG: hypothetical protein ACI8P9_000265 [Parasphingorhabdus sp.]|jgi:hypothetical protein